MTVRDPRLPFTVLLPDSRLQPIEIHDHLTSLRMALVEKDSVHLLGPAWNAPGVYVLLDQVQADGTFGVYVGKAPAGVRDRLSSHERKKVWARALVIQRDGQYGLSSAHTGWLEGDLYDLFSSAEKAKLHNSVKPGDDTVPPTNCESSSPSATRSPAFSASSATTRPARTKSGHLPS